MGNYSGAGYYPEQEVSEPGCGGQLFVYFNLHLIFQALLLSFHLKMTLNAGKFRDRRGLKSLKYTEGKGEYLADPMSRGEFQASLPRLLCDLLLLSVAVSPFPDCLCSQSFKLQRRALGKAEGSSLTLLIKCFCCCEMHQFKSVKDKQ